VEKVLQGAAVVHGREFLQGTAPLDRGSRLVSWFSLHLHPALHLGLRLLHPILCLGLRLQFLQPRLLLPLIVRALLFLLQFFEGFLNKLALTLSPPFPLLVDN
jgi:hypothetical protein